MHNPKVSIIIPIFNSVQYLNKCLDSAINQTLDDIEIICVDNNSSDDSCKIYSQYKKDFPNKFIISEESQAGANHARQKGLDLAKGEFILFLDSDDWLEPQACEICYNLATLHGYDLIEFSYRSVYMNDNELLSTSEDIMTIDFKDKNPLDPNLFNQHRGILANLFISKELFLKNNIKLIKLPLFEDTFSSYLIYYYCKNFIAIKSVLYNYLRRDNSSISKAFTQDGPELLLNANRAFIEELNNKQLLSKHPEFLLQFLFANLLISEYWLIGLKSFRERKNYISQVIDLINNSAKLKNVEVITFRGKLIKLFIITSLKIDNNINTLFFLILRKIYKIISNR